MKSFFKRNFTIGLSLVIALGIVVISLSVIRKDATDKPVAKSENTGLEAVFEKRESKTLEEWEKEVLNRKTNVASARVSYTESLGKSVLEEYFRAKAENTTINEDEIVKKILEKNSVEEIQKEIEYEIYEISDLNVIAQNDIVALKKYGNTLGEVASKNVYDRSLGGVSQIITSAVGLNDADQFKKLTPIIESYENFIADLLKMSAPSDVTDIHLNIINSVSYAVGSIKQIDIFLEDPFRGLFVMVSFGRAASDFQYYLKELDKVMKNKGVVFNDNEPGISIEKASKITAETIKQQ